MVNYIGTERLRALVSRIGVGRFIEELAAKSRRLPTMGRLREIGAACQPLPAGVIELMPTTDGRLYSFKYVNGHPKTRRRVCSR